MMVKSCKKFGYEVVQLSDMGCPEVPGVDLVSYKQKTIPAMIYRYQRLTEIEPPFVLMDTDMLVTKDISGGFGEDVAMTWRDPHRVAVRGMVIPMPWNGGLVFVNDRNFVADVYDHMKAQTPIFQEWYGDQIALRDVASRYKVKRLESAEWNYSPDGMEEIKPDVRVYHFKGKRKYLMPKFAERIG